MKNEKRKTFIVDENLQNKLARRIVMYWGVTWLLVFTLPIMVRMVTEQLPFNQLATQIIQDFWFPIFISVFLIPIVVWDSFRFSHRMAGPLIRVNKSLQQMAANQPVNRIQIRENDFCHDLVDNLNDLIEKKSQHDEYQQEQLEAVV